ncbi:MAG: hypothetical protein JSW48_09360 [Betaproteobacteria bacterium]|jgi:hypothetical protein|nr:MAG: hypothetical protein JSW48_09360 [Betaproteobacteria bacterium]
MEPFEISSLRQDEIVIVVAGESVSTDRIVVSVNEGVRTEQAVASG